MSVKVGEALEGGRRNREEELYAAARRLFAERGYAATTFDHIAKDLGIHKSSIFHYVATKQDLLAGALGRGFSAYVDRLREIAAGQEPDSVTRLESAVLNHVDFVLHEPESLGVFLRERRHLRGERGQQYWNMAREYESLFATIIDNGVKEGRFVATDVSTTTKFLLGACNWMVEWYRTDGALSPEDMKKQAVFLLVQRMLVAKDSCAGCA